MRVVVFGALILVLVLAAVTSIGSADDQPAKPAEARTLEFELERGSLKNVEDEAGRWQFEGGRVLQQGEQVGNYASTKRVVNQGTEDQNTAMVTITIFFLGNKPPQNITLQGAHDFNSGNEIGSVSAASGEHAAFIGKGFSVENNKLVIN